MKKTASIIILIVFTAIMLTGCEGSVFSKIDAVFSQSREVFGELSSLLFDEGTEAEEKTPDSSQENYSKSTEQRAS